MMPYAYTECMGLGIKESKCGWLRDNILSIPATLDFVSLEVLVSWGEGAGVMPFQAI